MKKRIVASFLPLSMAPEHAGSVVSNTPLSYVIGGIIALLILGYLIYTLLRPEKF